MLLLAAGCAHAEHEYTAEQFVRATKWCHDNARMDQGLQPDAWFSRFVACRREHVMPFEIQVFRREKEVGEMYDELARIAPLVDKKQVSARCAMMKWQQLMQEKLAIDCAITVEHADGGGQCAGLRAVQVR
ncbi:hypothetical protein GPA19_09235 [Azoarcus indigens]|uniref:Uncharacterized protein n=1 Tax=Azoarcus indigens TaxID=29545 RepID=A0A4R6DWL5_9RHOO|nr:hypothetical protein [Azoarcus indigens]NMG65128.1 hypothetical protein [Azoarcus indigens]TDN49613.1 hypothetical protein C7389_11192 [Azoarcus indigens]